MFVMYDAYVEDQPLDERRKTLWRWLDGPCQCERCIIEETAATLEAETGEKEQWNGSVKHEWDLEEKPIFPEDLLNLKN